MRRATILIVLLLTSLSVNAQFRTTTVYFDPDNMKDIEECEYRIIYDYTFIDNVKYANKYNDLCYLDIGKNVSRFYSRYAMIVDSIMYSSPVVKSGHAEGVNPHLWMAPAQMETHMEVYMNYPKKGYLSYINRFYKSQVHLYEEEIPKMDWKINFTESEDILSYNCFSATTHFRGVDWKVWFTTDIPLSIGPWKFNGLPGLVLKAEESNGYFIWEAIGIQNINDEYVKIVDLSKYQTAKTTRENVNQLLDLRWKDSYLFIANNGDADREMVVFDIQTGEETVERVSEGPSAYIPNHEKE